MVDLVSVGFTVGGLLFGADNLVSVGDFVAFGLETPEKMPFGGTQKIVTHKFLGGARVIDVLGADEAEITWSGFFFGPLAQFRAQSVDAMRQAGDAVPLVWPGDMRNVIVTGFHCSYERGGAMLPYTIACTVLPNFQAPSPPGLLSTLAGDATYALWALQTML